MQISSTEAMVISILTDAAIKQIFKQVSEMTEEEMLAKIRGQEARHDDLMAEVEGH